MKLLQPLGITLLAAVVAAPASAVAGPDDKPAAPRAQDKDKGKDKDKKAAEEKKPSPAPRKVYTEDDLKKYSEDPEGESKKKADPSETPVTVEDPQEPSEMAHGGRNIWQLRASDARDRVSDAQAKVNGLEAKIARLRDDRTTAGAMEPYRLQRIESEKAAAMQELEAAQKELATAHQKLEEFLLEARREGVPEGWVREP